MAGGGFLAHANDSSKSNRSALRKTLDKRQSLTTIRGAKGDLDHGSVDTEETQETLARIKRSQRIDVFKRLILVFVLILLFGLVAFKILL